jgi:hypothetical protein
MFAEVNSTGCDMAVDDFGKVENFNFGARIFVAQKRTHVLSA